jgi:AraC-like DNA-binding protein
LHCGASPRAVFLVQAMSSPRIWQSDDLGGVELLRATLTGFEFRPHAHEDFFIALTEDGMVRPAYRGGTHVIGPGDLIVLNPEEPHAGGPREGPWRYRAIYLPAGAFEALVPGLCAGRAGVPRFQPVSVAAAEAGFCDQAHLSRRFRQVVGVTPGEYARASRTQP